MSTLDFDQPIQIDLVTSYLIKDKNPWNQIYLNSTKSKGTSKLSLYMLSELGIHKFIAEK